MCKGEGQHFTVEEVVVCFYANPFLDALSVFPFLFGEDLIRIVLASLGVKITALWISVGSLFKVIVIAVFHLVRVDKNQAERGRKLAARWRLEKFLANLEDTRNGFRGPFRAVYIDTA